MHAMVASYEILTFNASDIRDNQDTSLLATFRANAINTENQLSQSYL